MSPASQTELLTSAFAGRYRIERELGAGGMATVYLAADLKHDRKVAIKVLKPELAAVLGAERFVVEIKTTASLQHPHILPLFDSGTVDGLPFYVMPYVQGETIREKLNRETQFGIDEAVRIAREVADALDYAHRHGVIHRDIKPENILLHDGRALVMDFGIALAVSAAAGGRLTETGLSLGTPHYMSPEQATAEKEITSKSDVYSLASVLYEMLAGQPPHLGGSAQQIIRKIIAEPVPPVTQFRKAVPANVAAAVEKALEKLPADRWSTAAAFASALSTVTATMAAPRRAWRSERGSLQWLAIPVALAAGYWLAPRFTTSAAYPAAVLTVSLPLDLRLARVPGAAGYSNSRVAIAPNGSLLVLAAIRVGTTRTQLYLRRLNGTELTPIQGTEGGDQPFFSPDGTWIGFVQDGRLRRVATAGGAPSTIAETLGIVNGLSWGPGDVIVFGLGSLMQLSVTEGVALVVALPDTIAAESFISPQILPDGKTVLAQRSIPQGGSSVVAVTLATGDTTTVVEGAASGRYVHAGIGDRLLYVAREGTVMAAPFDLRRRRVSGPAVPVASAGGFGFGSSVITVALNGMFAFQSGVPMRRELVIREFDGTLTTLTDAGVRAYRTARFSADGKQIATGVHNGADALSDIWTYDLERRTPSRLTFEGSSNIPEYSPDGRWISYNSLVRPKDRDLLRVRVGGGPPETLLAAPGQQHEGNVTRDGATLVYREINARTLRDIWAVDLTQPLATRLDARRPLAATAADEFGIALSPDGKWLAFTSTASGGGQEVYVRPLADEPGLQRVSPSGGGEARWDPLGRALFYRNGDTAFSVAIDRTPTFRLGARSVVFIESFVRDALGAYDVSPDGRRFLLLRDLEAGRVGELTVVQHALDALDRRGRVSRQ